MQVNLNILDFGGYLNFMQDFFPQIIKNEFDAIIKKIKHDSGDFDANGGAARRLYRQLRGFDAPIFSGEFDHYFEADFKEFRAVNARANEKDFVFAIYLSERKRQLAAIISGTPAERMKALKEAREFDNLQRLKA